MSTSETPTPPTDRGALPPEWRYGRIVATPPPTSAPVYARTPGRAARQWTIQEAIDGTFFVIGALLVLWLGAVLIFKSLSSDAYLIGYLILFWPLLAYIALPRLQEFLAKIYVPDYFIGRTVTGIGVLGDPINLALDGDAATVHAVMRAAGWTRADPVTLRSSWGIIQSAVFRTAYPAAPVSPLLLFGRQEDFAYEREVDDNAAQRHHVRFWQVPPGWVLPGGYEAGWLASATYDRKVGLSLFTLQVTHKVDADIDAERDFVVATARYGSPGLTLRMIDDFSTAFHTRNGGGDLVHGDGNLAILDLQGLAVPAAASADPAGTSASASAAASAPAFAASATSAAASAPGRRGATAELLARRLPPPALLLSGAMSMIKAAMTLGAVLSAAFSSSGHVRTANLVLISVGAALTIALWVLTLARQAWARTILMAVCTADAISELAALTRAHHTSQILLATASLSVLILIAVSSAAGRRWTDRHRERTASGTPAQSTADLADKTP